MADTPTINILPFIPSDPDNSFSTTLNDTQYYFDVHWNERDKSWYFDMYESGNLPVAIGVKIVLGTFLGRQSPHPFFKDNIITAVDTSLTYVDPGFDDLGTRVQVHHYTLQSWGHAVLSAVTSYA